MHALVPCDKTTVTTKQILTRSQPFEMFYTLNCQNLCADFQESLEFRFSWGITAMIQRFTGKAKSNKGAILSSHHQQSNGVSIIMTISVGSIFFKFSNFHFFLQIPKLMSPSADSNTPMCLIPTTTAGISPEQLSIISRFAVASIGSQGTVGGLVVGGLVCI